jgi:uncharacterized damage-inducible protein DinB
MKDHFLKLFVFDTFENEAIVAAMIEAGSPKPAEKVMAHLLTAQQVWLNRCKNIPPSAPLVLWPDWKTGTFRQTIQDTSQQWADFLSTLANEDFEKTIAYKNATDSSFENRLTDILTHVINHGTHHRAQIGQHLKQAGLEKLPNTDYIAFIRADLLR